MAEVAVLLLAALAMAATFMMLHPRLEDDDPVQLHEGRRPRRVARWTDHFGFPERQNSGVSCQAAGLALCAAVLAAVLCGSLTSHWTHLMKSTPLRRKLQARFPAVSADLALSGCG